MIHCKLELRKFQLNMTRNFFTLRVVTKHGNKLPREAMESASLEILKNHLDTFLCNIL